MNMNLHALLQTPVQQGTAQTVQTRTEGAAQKPTALSKEFAELLVAMQNSIGAAYAPSPDQDGASLTALAATVDLAVKTDTTSEPATEEAAPEAGMTDPMQPGIQAATAHAHPAHVAGLPTNPQTGNTEQATAIPHSIAATADSKARQQHQASHLLPDAETTLNGDAVRNTQEAREARGSNFAEIARQEASLAGQKAEVATQPAGTPPPAGLSPERSETGMNPGISGTTTASDTAAPARAPVQAQLQTHVSSPQWRQELGQQLVTLAQNGERQISLQLNPQDLGPLNIEIKVSEQLAQMHMSSNHAQVRTALEQALPQLRDALMEQGISLGETSISDQQPKQRESFSNNSGRQHSANTAQNLPAAADITESGPAQTDSLQGINLYV